MVRGGEDAIAALVLEPWRGAKEGGWPGLARGIVKGAVRASSAPLKGLASGADQMEKVRAKGSKL